LLNSCRGAEPLRLTVLRPAIWQFKALGQAARQRKVILRSKTVSGYGLGKAMNSQQSEVEMDLPLGQWRHAPAEFQMNRVPYELRPRPSRES
jgi:hypothetical protein